MGSFGRETDLAVQIIGAGNSLLNPPSSVDGLLSILDEVESLLSNVEQAPPTSMQDALLPLMKALISTDLLKHQNVNVRVSVASCITEITRISAPDAPYNDDIMKEIFQLTVEAIGNLADASTCCYRKAELILDTVSKVRSCLVMLDLELDELILDMFQHFFKIVRSKYNHPQTVISAMETIMTMVIDESEEVSSDLLNTLLASVRKENENLFPVSWELGEKVLSSCACKLKPYIAQALKSTSNSFDMYSAVVASVCQNESIATEPHKIVPSEEHQADEKKSEKKMVSGEPLEGIVEQTLDTVCRDNLCQAEDDTSAPVINDGTTPTDTNKILKKRNSRNVLKGSLIRGLSKSSDAKTKSEMITRKRGWKPNSLMNPDEGYDHSWISSERRLIRMPLSKKPRRKGIDDASSESLVSKKTPLSKETRSLSSGVRQTMVISLPTRGSGLKGSRKRSMSKKEEIMTDQVSNSPPLLALKKEASGAQIEKKDPSFSKASVKIEPEEEHEMTPKQKQSVKSGNAKKIRKSRKKTKVQNGFEEAPVQEQAKEVKVKTSSGKRSLVRSDSKKKKSVEAIPDKVTNEASKNKKMNTPVATKSSGEGTKESPKGNPKRKRTPKKEVIPDLGEDLVGRRIKVWWPLDKTFYEGVVDLYDDSTKKHRVMYADGDAEVLNLTKECWEFIEPDASVREDQEKDQPESSTLSEMLRKKKEHRSRRRTKQENGSSSARRSSAKRSKKKHDEKDTAQKDKKEAHNAKLEPQETKTHGGKDPKSLKGAKDDKNPKPNEAVAMTEGEDGK